MTELPNRLLRDALRAGPPEAAGACVDADALAAWSDGTMSRAARAAFEIHAAGCARCQALMAAMARTEPPPIELIWWRRARFSWLMPLAAATAAIVIVVSLSTGGGRVEAPQLARSEPAAVAPPRADDIARPNAAAAPAPAPAAPRVSAPANQGARREPAVAAAPTTRPKDQPEDVAGFAAAKPEPRPHDVSANAAPAPAPPPSPPSPPATAAPAIAAPPTAAPAAAAESPLAAAAPPASAGASSTPDTTTQYRAGLRQERQLTMKAVAPLLIASPVRHSQWRIVGSAVAHTEDGGVNWQTQPLDIDVAVRAGASPATRVCWLVGARGLVLLTTDAVRWRRMAFPESVDLVAVQATDASHATVTAADGRRFSTSDGGATWTGRPPDRY